MASFMSDLLKPYVEKLINGAIAEARHVFCFTCITKEFEEERARLEAERITLGQHSKVAIRRDKDIQANVGFWEEEVDKLIQEDTKIKQTCFYGFCPNCKWRYKRGKELANNMKEMKRLIERGDKLQNIELPRRLPDVERCSSQNYISFKSRESKCKELLDALKDESNYITGLQGMGGTGKTTLAKEVGKKLKQSEQFVHVIDTTVSFTPDIKKIQDDIAGPLGLKWEDCNESDRPKRLWSRLTNGEKILLIMDDVWDQDPPLDFDAIGIPKRDNHEGCRVLITSRSKQTFNKMDCDKRIELDLLSEEDAWIMFKKYVGLCDSSSKKLIGKGRKIATECKQLPVAIAVIASSLKGQLRREHEWDVTLKSLKKPVSVHGVDDDMVGIYKCLKFSYDYLKDEKAKKLFLLCSLFREDEEIWIEVLVRLCIGIGIFGEDYGSYDDARNQVVVAKNKLLDSCLLLEVGEKVKMHDLVRDVAQWIANKELCSVNFSNKNQNSLVEKETNIKHLSCEGKVMDLFSWKFDGSQLETLIVNVDRDEDDKCMEVPNSFFENIIKLRLLYFSSNYYKRILSLPQSIQSLTNIRSMLVNMMDLGDISVLGNLQSLESLDLDVCTINELPSEITKLEKFKLLSLGYCEIRRNNPFEVIEGCASLEELYFIGSFNDFCQEITIPELQRYHICDWMEVKNYSLSKCVNFRARDVRFFSKETLKYCMQTAQVLELDSIMGEWRNLMPDIIPIDLGMNDLLDLYLSCISELQCLIDITGTQVPTVLSKLVVLSLNKLENLEELFCNGPISFDSLKNLEKLAISECKHLRRLFNCKLNFCNLETLEIANCEGLENIIADERREEESREEIDDGNKSHGSMFPKLKVLDIEDCPLLEYIFPFLSTQDLPALESIRIKRCDGLKYIFGQYQHFELGSLRELMLWFLPNFIDFFRECNQPMSSCVKGSSSTSCGSKAQKELDPIKCNILSWTQICCHRDQPSQDYSESNSFCFNKWEGPPCLSRQSKIMSNIKGIDLFHVPKIKSIFIPRMLETLTIVQCDELKHIIIDTGDHDDDGNSWGTVVFPKLKNIFIGNCVQLLYLFGHYTNHHQQHAEIHIQLPALEDVCLRSLASLVAICPKQYHTTFSPVKNLELSECSQVATKSIGDFITRHSITRSVDGTIIKELSENMVEHFLTLKSLMVDSNSKVESIFCTNEVNDQKMDLELQIIVLKNLPMMTCLFVGPKNSFVLRYLEQLKIVGCEKLEIVFSTSILKCLPQLRCLMIEECKELKHILKDDVENNEGSNSLSSRISFPMLETLVIGKCNKLKCVFPISVSKKFPKLKIMMIREADELEEIFKSEGDDLKVEIPNLYVVGFINLPSLSYAQGIQVQAVENRFVRNCQKLSLTSASTFCNSMDIYHLQFGTAFELREDFMNLVKQFQEESEGHNFRKNLETIEKFLGIEAQATSGHKLTSSQELMNEQSLYQYLLKQEQTLGEIDSTIKHSPANNLEGSTSERTVETTLSTTSETSNKQPIQLVSPKQKGIEISVEEGNTLSTHFELLSSTSDPLLVTSEHKTFSQEYGDGQIAIPFFPTSTTVPLTIEDIDIIEYLEITQTNNDQGEDFWDRLSFLNEDAFKKVSSMIEEQFPSKDFDLYLHMESAFPQFQGEYKGQDNGHENPNAQTTKEFASRIEVQAALGHNLTSSKIKMKETTEEEHEFVENVLDLEIPSLVLFPTNSEEVINEQSMDQQHISTFLLEEFINEQSMDHQYLMNQQHSLEETTTTDKPSHGNNFLKEAENQSIQYCPTSEKTAAATFSTILGTKIELPIQLVAPKPKASPYYFISFLF